MKIAYLSSSYLELLEANSNHVMQMCDAFRELGHDVELYAIGRNNSNHHTLCSDFGLTQEFPIHRFSPLSARLIDRFTSRSLRQIAKWLGLLTSAAVGVRRQIRLQQPDLIYARNRLWLLLAPLGITTTILEVHRAPSRRWEVLFERLLLLRCRPLAIVVISESLENWYRHHLHSTDTPRLILARDAARPQPPTEPTDTASSSAASTVGYVGSLGVGRGLGLIGRLAVEFPETSFFVVGGDPEEIKTAGKSLPGNVTLIERMLPKDLPSVYDLFEIALAPYESKVFGSGTSIDTARWMSPLKIFEYMSFGKAIIASRLPAIEEIVCDGEDGLLASPFDLNEWVDQLDLLLHDQQVRQKLSANARLRQLREFTWVKRAESILVSLSSGRAT